MRAANALHSLSIHLLRRARAADKETGLSPERISLLSVLNFVGPQTVGALAEIEDVSAPAISRIVSALETLGLAKRERARADARQVLVCATAKGRRLVERGRRGRIEIIAEALAVLSPAELAEAVAIAEAIEKAGDCRGLSPADG